MDSKRYSNLNTYLQCAVISITVCVLVPLIFGDVVLYLGYRKCDENLRGTKISLQLYENINKPLREELNQKKTELEIKTKALKLPQLELKKCVDKAASLENANKRAKEESDSAKEKLSLAIKDLEKEEKNLGEATSKLNEKKTKLSDCERITQELDDKIRNCENETENLKVAEKTYDFKKEIDELKLLERDLELCRKEEAELMEALAIKINESRHKKKLLRAINSLLYPGKFVTDPPEIIKDSTSNKEQPSDSLIMLEAEITPFSGNASMTMGALFDSKKHNDFFRNDRPLKEKRNDINLILGRLLSALLSLKEFPIQETFKKLLEDTGERLKKLLLLEVDDVTAEMVHPEDPTFDVRIKEHLETLCVDPVIIIGLNTGQSLSFCFKCCIKPKT